MFKVPTRALDDILDLFAGQRCGSGRWFRCVDGRKR
jgi:hypothetical protein